MTNFKKFYDNVRNKDAGVIRTSLEQLVSSQTFRNWANGTYEPDSKYWGKINRIANQYGYRTPYLI